MGKQISKPLTDATLASALDEAAIVAKTDVKGAIVHCNDLFCRISGYSREELIGADHRILNSGAHDRNFFKEMYRTIARGAVWKGTICNRNKGGSKYWVDTTIVPQLDGAGRPIGYVSIRFEVTEHIKALEALADARVRAEAAARAKRRFLAKVGHELRTPLAIIAGMAHLLEKAALDADQQRAVLAIIDSSDALDGLLNDVLDFSGLEAGEVKLTPAPADPQALLGAIETAMRRPIEAKGLSFSIKTIVLPPLILVDALRLRQVLTNLLVNATQFTDTGFVELEVLWEDERLHCLVRDSGSGFNIGDKDLLFKPFEQGIETRDRGHDGAGLGLAISSVMVGAMGGELDAVSEPGKGSAFFFSIAAPRCEVRPPPSMAAAGHEPCAQPEILVAEDNPAIQTLFRRILEAADCAVTLVSNGEEAVTAVQENPFDLCLMDLRMPRLDGFAAARAIRKLPQGDRLPIYAVSADVLDGREIAEANGDFDGFLSKPLRPDHLLALIGRPRARAGREDLRVPAKVSHLPNAAVAHRDRQR